MDDWNSLNAKDDLAWVYSLKKKMIMGLLGLLIVTTITSMVLIAIETRKRVMVDSAEKTQELAETIKSSLRTLMLKRDPNAIQDTLDDIGKNRDSIVQAFILDKSGRIAYSTEKKEIGKVLNRFAEQSCQGCHREIGKAPADITIIIEVNGVSIQRNVKVIFNEPACFGCHARTDRINGKLIIDRSLRRTAALISSLEVIILGSGGLCLIIIVPFLIRQVNKFVTAILSKNREVELLVAIAKRLSRTIDVKELRGIAANVVSATFDADEVTIIHPKDSREYRLYRWERNKNELMRSKIDRDPHVQEKVLNWLDNRLVNNSVSPDGREVYMPIAKGTTGLALIALRKQDRAFDSERLKFIDPVKNYMAIAFENAQLYSMAITDELTRLYSVRHFHYSIEREFQTLVTTGGSITLLMIDIDNFKRVNDTYGHPVGDVVLRQSAQCLLRSIRDNDLAFRYGGEELVVLLPSTEAEGGASVAERIRGRIENYIFEEGSHQLRITVSIGLASYPQHAANPKDLLSAADTALYTAKKTGKNRVVVSGKD
jgi:diguanylate cyclase (GGDEF)-like protein